MRRDITTIAFVVALTGCTMTHVDQPPAMSPNGVPTNAQPIYSDGWTNFSFPTYEVFEKDYKRCQDESRAPSSDGQVPRDQKFAFEQCMRKLGYSKDPS